MSYHPKVLKCLSVMQIITAVISILLGIASAAVRSDYTSYVGFGIWLGVWILVAGLLGYFGSRDPNTPNKCLLGTFMGFAIAACVLCGVMFICYCVALGILNEALKCHRARRNDYNFFIHHSRQYDCHGTSYSGAQAGIGIGSVLLIISVLEFFVAMTSSIYCCNAMCCVQKTTQHVVYQQQGVGPGGVMIVPGGAVGGGVVLTPSVPVMPYPEKGGAVQQPPPPPPQSVLYQTTYPVGYASGYAPNAMYTSPAPPVYSATPGLTGSTQQT